MQGNLDPITLFAPPEVLEFRVREILRARPTVVPVTSLTWSRHRLCDTPVENDQAVVKIVREFKLEDANA